MSDVFWHSRELEELYKHFDSSQNGLSDEAAAEKLKKTGLNELREGRTQTPLELFIEQFKSFIVLIMVAAAIISLAVGVIENSPDEITSAFAIIIVVAFTTVVGFIQEYKADRGMQALKKMTPLWATVLRGGHIKRISARELVPGDIIFLEAGDRIPADCRLIEVTDFQVDESALTGESMPVRKDVSVLGSDTPLAERKNMVYMGTHASYGKAKALVVATGMNSELGRIAEKIQSMEREKTPLQIKLDAVGKQIGYIVLILCGIVFVAGLLKMSSGFSLKVIISMAMVSIALAVAAVPSGLPAVITITLAKGMQEMVKKNALVKKLTAVETLGSTAVICSDKTGTLTRNEMTVRKIYLLGKTIDVSGEGYIPVGGFSLDGKPYSKDDADLKLLLKAAALANNASLENIEGRWRIVGDPTEAALIVAASKADLWKRELEEEYRRVAEISFSSERKRMTTIHLTPEGEKIAYVKGAPDVLLNLCSFVLEGGEVRRMSEEDRKKILSVNDEFAAKALRVIGVAYKVVDKNARLDASVEDKLIFLGLLGMIDPPREDAIAAVREAQRAGIKVVMITGDHKLTAVAVAREMGIYKEGDKVMTGQELELLTDADYKNIVEDVVIYSRTSPEHKLKIVSAFKEKGYVVAMTGDGVNDAPALKKVDIGVAMGVTGTDVAKEASDMILLDDNFASIVAAVKEGRNIYSNIQLSIKYLLSCNIGEVVSVFVGIMALSKLPLTALQILWMNFLTDAAPALALSWNPADEYIMSSKPRNPKENIINRSSLIGFLSIGLLTGAGTLFVFFSTLPMESFAAGSLHYSVKEFLANYITPSTEVKAGTMAFTTIIMFQLFYVLACRSEKMTFFRAGVFSNKYLLGSVLLSFGLQILIIYHPFFQEIFKTVPISLSDWLLIVMVSSTSFILTELWKTLRR